MITSLLIANRGEIARRIIRTAKQMGITTIAIASPQDRDALHVSDADHAVLLEDGAASANYLNQQAVIDAALRMQAQAIHPGYGFLSENPEFAQAVADAGLIFVGPPAHVIAQMGHKDEAKKRMAAAGVPVVPGYLGDDQSDAVLADEAAKTGYPVLIKARSGGGGKGMRLVWQAEQFAEALESARREASASFGDDKVLIEKYITRPRHIEVQILSDKFGRHLHLFERDCSLQRRHQKVIEEAPAPFMPEAVREAMTQAALKAAEAIGYENAGTIEFIADGTDGLRTDGFWFMEMNTRLQVEHPVTEAVTGVDLVQAQLEIASGLPLRWEQQDIHLNGHAVEARLYAEDPEQDFRPTPGMMRHLHYPEAPGLRIESGICAGDEISSSYDPMIAKIITHHATRQLAFQQSAKHLSNILSVGTTTNRDFLVRLCRMQCAENAPLDTDVIAQHTDQLCMPQAANPRLLAAASLAYLQNAGSIFSGWRQWGGGQTVLHFTHSASENPLECRLDCHPNGNVIFSSADTEISCSDITISPLPDGVMQLEIYADGQPLSAHYVMDNGVICIAGDGDQLTLSTHNTISDKAVSDADGDITAPMTAVVRSVQVQVGDIVSAQDVLIQIEAMKMEYPLISPFDGIVQEVYCKVGDTVSGSDLLMQVIPHQTDEGSDG